MKPISEKDKLQLGQSFLAAWKERNWENMRSILSEDVAWSLPGTSILSGVVSGRDAIATRARQLKDFGVMVEVRHILFSQHRLALSVHNTANRGDLSLSKALLTNINFIIDHSIRPTIQSN